MMMTIIRAVEENLSLMLQRDLGVNVSFGGGRGGELGLGGL